MLVVFALTTRTASAQLLTRSSKSEITSTTFLDPTSSIRVEVNWDDPQAAMALTVVEINSFRQATSCSLCGGDPIHNNLPNATVTDPPYDGPGSASHGPLLVEVSPLQPSAHYIVLVDEGSVSNTDTTPTNHVDVKIRLNGVDSEQTLEFRNGRHEGALVLNYTHTAADPAAALQIENSTNPATPFMVEKPISSLTTPIRSTRGWRSARSFQ